MEIKYLSWVFLEFVGDLTIKRSVTGLSGEGDKRKKNVSAVKKLL